MLKQSAKLDARGWVIGFGSLWLLVAVAKRDYFAAVAAVGVIIAGFANYVDHHGPRLRWALVGLGLVVAAAGIYLKFEHQ